MNGDANGSEIEVIPLAFDMVPGVGDPNPMTPIGFDLQPWEVHFVQAVTPRKHGSTHAALSSPLTQEEIFAIGRRERWRTVRCDRSPAFPVIEFWLENRFLLEVLTPEMARQYTSFMTPRSLAALFGMSSPERAARPSLGNS